MPKISKDASLKLSLVFTSAFIAFVAFAMIFLPVFFDRTPLLKQIFDWFAEKESPIDGGIVFWVWMYTVMLICETCSVAVLFLLFRVKNGLVFSEKSVAIIRFVSWGCMLIAVCCLAVEYYLHMAYFIAMAAVFLGLCLRVVKNVIEEATAIKNENDFTV